MRCQAAAGCSSLIGRRLGLVRLQRSVHRAGTLGDLLLPRSCTLFFLQLDGNQRGGVEAMGEGPSLPAAEGALHFPKTPLFYEACVPVWACKRRPILQAASTRGL